MSIRITLVGVADEQLRRSAETVPHGALIISVVDGPRHQTFASMDRTLANLKPGLIVCLGAGFEFFYCGRRLRLLPTSDYQVEGTLYDTVLPTFTSTAGPFENALEKPSHIGDTVRAILDAYGPEGLVQFLVKRTSA